MPRPLSPLAQELKRLRCDLKEDPATFGARFGCSGRTIENWEQGRRKPDRRAAMLLGSVQATLERESPQHA